MAAGDARTDALSGQQPPENGEQAAGGDSLPPSHTVVMVSSGAGSAMAWKRTVDRYGPDKVTGLFADVNGEHPDNYRFLHEVMCWVDAPLVVLDNGGQTIWQVFRQDRFIGNTMADLCSRKLKREPMRRWLEANYPADSTTVAAIGYDIDEGHRITKAERHWAPFQLEAPLTWDPVLFRHEAHAGIEAAGIALPWLTRQGFPHANCGGGCVKAGKKQWRLLLRVDRAEYLRWEAEEAAWQVAIGKDNTILRDRRGGVTRPLSLLKFRLEVEAGALWADEDWGSCNCLGEWEADPLPLEPATTSAITLADEVETYLLARYEQPLTIGGAA